MMMVIVLRLMIVRSSGFSRSVPSRERRDGTPNMMLMPVSVMMLMVVGVGQMDIQFHAFDAGFLLARDVQVIAVELQFLQLALQFAGVHAKVQQRADEHIAADAAENVEVKRSHGCDASALI
jgi:hypothetical protein